MLKTKNRYKLIALDKEQEKWLKEKMELLLPDDQAVIILAKIQGRKK